MSHRSVTRERRARAVSAASGLATELGIACSRGRVIADANNTIVHLAPSPLIAKVGTSTIRGDAAAVLERELAVGQYLAQRGAPIAPPATHVPPGPHVCDGVVVTLWTFIEANPGAPASEHALAAMLRRFHEAFAGYPAPLPHFTDELTRARAALEEPSHVPALSESDRSFLLEEAAEIGRVLTKRDPGRHPLHGDPHLDGNVLLSDEGPVLVDFEAACLGPYEWDLTSLEPARSAYPDADPELLAVLTRMRSLLVSTSCWRQYGRSPEVDEAAHVHLSILRARGPIAPGAT